MWSCWSPQQRCKSGDEADLFNLKGFWGQNNMADRMEFLELAPQVPIVSLASCVTLGSLLNLYVMFSSIKWGL